jgi:type 1 fimbriae regulatory protein FimE
MAAETHRTLAPSPGSRLKLYRKGILFRTVIRWWMAVFLGFPAMNATAPITEIGTVVKLHPNRPPRRRTNLEVRTREYLTEAEVDQLVKAAKKRGRYGHRDATMILMAYHHGLRVSELVALQWTQVDFEGAWIHINRLKEGRPSDHPLSGNELRDLRKVRKGQPVGSKFIFVSERGAPMTARGFAQMLSRAAASIEFPIAVHPHMLRHACGFKLANDRQDTRAIQQFLGHKQIQHTVRYTELRSDRFDGFWKD